MKTLTINHVSRREEPQHGFQMVPGRAADTSGGFQQQLMNMDPGNIGIEVSNYLVFVEPACKKLVKTNRYELFLTFCHAEIPTILDIKWNYN